jgi:uncharacterized RDD family membrane protein YckC
MSWWVTWVLISILTVLMLLFLIAMAYFGYAVVSKPPQAPGPGGWKVVREVHNPAPMLAWWEF